MRVSVCVLFLTAPIILLVAASRASAQPHPSSDIPTHVLDECDAQATPYGGYDQNILAATEALAALGAFTKSEFGNVKIGFCDLRGVEGPVATTSCARDTILLDNKYANQAESFVLSATLAHEMKHYLQHKEQKARFGEGYCFSDRYNADKPQLEVEADEFGDNVAEFLFVGRPIEINNECPATVSVYLEADSPSAATRDFDGFVDVAAQSTVTAPGRSASKVFKFYAQSEPHDGKRWFWRGADMAHKRIIDGKAYGLRRITLSNRSRASGPFLVKLTCS